MALSTHYHAPTHCHGAQGKANCALNITVQQRTMCSPPRQITPVEPVRTQPHNQS